MITHTTLACYINSNSNSTHVQFVFVDINECNNSTACEENQVCFNTAGSYLCECDYGYERDPNSLQISPGVYQGCKGMLCISILNHVAQNYW